MKRVSDILALSLLLIGIWIFTSLANFLEKVGIWAGMIGSVMLIVSQIYYLMNTWRRQ